MSRAHYNHWISCSDLFAIIFILILYVMEIDNNISSKRFRSEDSFVNRSSSLLSDELLACSFCTFNTSSPADFDFHNHIHHQHLCSQCLNIFPSYFLLDLHMDEVHNSYSQNRSYRCLIESCSKSFSTIEQRFQHINDEHHTKSRHLNEVYLLFFNRLMNEENNKKSDNKFGCDSQKAFLRSARLRPRQFTNTHWDADD